MKKVKWDKVARKYDSIMLEKGTIYHSYYINPLIMKSLGNIKGKKILDLACGNGYFSRKLAKRGASVIGIDYSEQLIKIAKSKNSDKLKIKFIKESSSNMKSQKNNSFDIIVSNMAFMDIENIDKTIKECSRLLKKNGKLIFSISHPITRASEKQRIGEKTFVYLARYLTPFEKNHPHFPEVKLYNRPIEYYMKLLFKNNFSVSGFFEIGTKHSKGKIIRNKKIRQQKMELPSFLIIEAKLIK